MPRMTARLWAIAACASVLIVTPLVGEAQQTDAPVVKESDTTVLDPLISEAFGPLVGDGATYFLPTELQLAAHEARQDGIDVRANVQQCRTLGAIPHREEVGDFDLEALWNTEAEATLDVWRKGEDAQHATEAALSARADLTAGKMSQDDAFKAELARQTAVKAYQAAQNKAREAHLRVSDLQAMALDYVSNNLAAVQDLEAGKYMIDCEPTGNGTITTSDSDQPHCARLDNVGRPRGEGMIQFKGDVELRSAERARGGGQGMYVPKEYQDLALSEVSAHEGEEKGVSFLRVIGKINNARKNATPVPPLWIAAVDRYGTELQAQQVEPRSAPKIPSGGSVPFIYVFKPMPEKTARATVTFAPFHRQSGPLPATAFCPN